MVHLSREVVHRSSIRSMTVYICADQETENGSEAGPSHKPQSSLLSHPIPPAVLQVPNVQQPLKTAWPPNKS